MTMSPCSPGQLQLELGPPAWELSLPLTVTSRNSCQYSNRSPPASKAQIGSNLFKMNSTSMDHTSASFIQL